MKNLYNRVENLDELIRKVKLPYLAWKILFLVNKKADSNEIANLLETDEEAVIKSMQLLITNELVFVDKEVSGETTAPESAEVPEETTSLNELTKPAMETLSDPDDHIEEILEEAPAAEEELSENNETDAEEPAAVEEQEKTEDQENIIPEIEDEQKPPDDVLDELINESETQDSDEIIEELLQEQEDLPEETLEDLPTEPDKAADELESFLEETSETEEAEDTEEKIEINIPESDEGDEISDEMEFNFNLTGEEKKTAAVEQEPPAETVEDSQDKSGFKKILVIDDSLVIRKMVEIALEEEELIIETAVSGKEGLEVMDQTNPDLVILDMMLPDINGIEILKTIKASKGIPVIMLSGKDSPQMIETAKNEGAEEFLPKPFKDDDLVEKIKKLI